MEAIDSSDSLSPDMEHGFEYWASRDSLAPATRDALLRAAIVLVPHENFGHQASLVFPAGTTELFRSLKEQVPSGIEVEIAVEENYYREVALHNDLIRLATMLVKLVAAPIAIGLLVEFLKVKLGSRFSKSEVEASLIVEQEGPGSRAVVRLNYKGPAATFEQTIKSDFAKAIVSKKPPPMRPTETK